MKLRFAYDFAKAKGLRTNVQHCLYFFSGLEAKKKCKASLVLLLRNGCKKDENLLESLAFLILKQCQLLCISASLRLFAMFSV